MSSMKIFDIAGSALSAQSKRLNLVASNMANADSVSSSVDETYRSRQPVFKEMVDQLSRKDSAVGVQMLGVVESKVPLQQEYAPDHPMANEEGYIFRPNVKRYRGDGQHDIGLSFISKQCRGCELCKADDDGSAQVRTIIEVMP